MVRSEAEALVRGAKIAAAPGRTKGVE